MERRNNWKGGINEHPFLQKIKIVGRRINKQSEKVKKKKNQIAYVEGVRRKSNWNDSFINQN